MQLGKLSAIIREELKDKEEIIAVYIFGSYLYNQDYEDIDVGILLKKSFNPGHLYEIKLQESLERAITEKNKEYQQIHIILLNNQDLRFLYGILGNSKLIFCRDTFKRAGFESRVITHYLDIKPFYDYYDKMRKLRYGT